MVTLTPATWPEHWAGAYRPEDVTHRLDARCACGGQVVALYRRHGQVPIVCDSCPGVFPDPELTPWAEAHR